MSFAMWAGLTRISSRGAATTPPSLIMQSGGFPAIRECGDFSGGTARSAEHPTSNVQRRTLNVERRTSKGKKAVIGER
jgi:hypothetical protein